MSNDMSRGDLLFFGVVGLGVAFVAFLLIGLFAAFIGFGTPIGDSTYTGIVVDVQHEEGLVWKTSQVVAKTNPQASDEQVFCMMDPTESGLLDKSLDELGQGDRVQISYHRPLWIPLWECPRGALIMDDIAPINSSAGR